MAKIRVLHEAKKLFLVLAALTVVAIAIYAVHEIRPGFTISDEPSFLERTVARTARELSIPRNARHEQNPWIASSDVLRPARESYLDRSAACHGPDAPGQTTVGRNLYSRDPDLRA